MLVKRSTQADHPSFAFQNCRTAAEYKPSDSIATAEHLKVAVVEGDNIEEVDDWEVDNVLGMEASLQKVHSDPASGGKDSIGLEGQASQSAMVYAALAQVTAHSDWSHVGRLEPQQR
jgi:hypothetical protein